MLVFVTATVLVFVTATVVIEETNGVKVDPVESAVGLEASVVVELATSAKTNKQLKEDVETVSISRTGFCKPQGILAYPDSRRLLRTRTCRLAKGDKQSLPQSPLFFWSA